MTAKRDLKSIIRDRQRKTGESYTAARSHVMRERDRLIGATKDARVAEHIRLEAAVLKVGLNGTARIRFLGEDPHVTLRSRETSKLAPGQIITLRLGKRWIYGGDTYASGEIEETRIDVARLGLEVLPLDGGDIEDLREDDENVLLSDPYAPIWLANTAKPRACYEMHEITWGALPGDDGFDGGPTLEAVELEEAGDLDGAHEVLMDVLLRDLRCLDAHAHLGNLVFETVPARALVHYEIGMRIGELFLPDGFDGALPWSALYNRPYLRCLHGYGLCLWRLGRIADAAQAFERILALNPNDNQGARFCLFDVRNGVAWEKARRSDDPHLN